MLYHLSEEHEMLRQFVREFAESQLAPNAAKVDDKGVFAQQQYDALVEAGFAAPGIPEQYGGCLLYTSPSPRDLSTSRMPSSA